MIVLELLVYVKARSLISKRIDTVLKSLSVLQQKKNCAKYVCRSALQVELNVLKKVQT